MKGKSGPVESTEAPEITVLPGTEQIIPEPDWSAIYEDETDIASATEYWHVLVTELRARSLLSPVNKHSIMRLVSVWIMFDNAHWQIIRRGGTISRPKSRDRKRSSNNNPIPRVIPEFSVMKDASTLATQLEGELGLAPRRREGAAHAFKQSRKERMSNAYLKKTG